MGCTVPATQWFSESLTSSKLHLSGLNPFVNLATPSGNITIHGKQNIANCPSSVGMPLLGVMSMQFYCSAGPFVGETPTGVGPGQGYIKDASEAYTADAVTFTWH